MSHTRPHRIRWVAPILAAAVGLTGCGGVGDSQSAPGEEGEDVDNPSGSIDTMGFSLQDVIATSRVEAFEGAYPDVDVQVAEGGFDEQQFLSAVGSGEPPSLIYLDRTELGTYAARGALTPLDDCIDGADIAMDDYLDAAVAQVTYDDQVYGIPEFNDVRPVLVNTDALDAAGLTTDDIDTSDWDALSSVNDRLSATDGGKLSRIGFDPKIPEFFPLWVAANGGQLVADDGMSVELNSAEAVEALEYTASLVDATAPWAQFKAFRDTWDFFGGQNQFVADQIGAFPMETWYIDVLGDVSPRAPVTGVPFLDRQGQPLTYATGQAWAIPTDAPNQTAACAFMATMTSADTWIEAAEASKEDREKQGGNYTGTYTANEVADETIFGDVYQPTGIEGLDQATQVAIDLQDAGFVAPASPAGAEIKKAWEDAVLRTLEGEQSAQESLDQAQSEAEDALAEATQ